MTETTIVTVRLAIFRVLSDFLRESQSWTLPYRHIIYIRTDEHLVSNSIQCSKTTHTNVIGFLFLYCDCCCFRCCWSRGIACNMQIHSFIRSYNISNNIWNKIFKLYQSFHRQIYGWDTWAVNLRHLNLGWMTRLDSRITILTSVVMWFSTKSGQLHIG